MTRLSDRGFDSRIADWLEADPNMAPPDLLRTVESALPSIPQRRVVHLPWRTPRMSTFTKLAVAAVAVIALGAVGIIALRPSAAPTVGSPPSASPSPSPPPSPASPSPSVAPPLSETFTSPLHGLSISYPAGWSTQPATALWTDGWPNFGDPRGDHLYDPVLRDHLFIGIASQPLAGKDDDQWAADTLAADGCAPSSPITIDGAAGLVGDECDAAAVTLDGQGYLIVLHTSGDEPWLADVYDRAWFEQLLATADLQPEATASPTPSP